MSSDTANRTQRDITHFQRSPGGGMVMTFVCMGCGRTRYLDGRKMTKRGWRCVHCIGGAGGAAK